jgi:hypothetical protein
MAAQRPLRIGVSGKRTIEKEERDKVRREIKTTIKQLLHEHGAASFIGVSALAYGADTLFAEVVTREFEMPLEVILPFEQAEYEKDFAGVDLETFTRLMKHAGAHTVATAGIPADDAARNAGYFAVGKKIVDECDEMVIVWDGLQPGGIGGTAEIIGYLAETKRQPHIPYIKVRPAKPDKLNEELIHTYERANKLAIKARDRYRRVWKWAILLGWLTVLCFALKTAFHIEGFSGRMLTLLEFLCVTVVYCLIFLARKRNYHGHYLQERLKAETCRLLRTFYQAGITVDISEQSKEQATMLVGVAEKVNRTIGDEKQGSKWYTQYVIKGLIHEQCEYHENKVRSIGNNHSIFERFNLLIGVLFFVNLAVHLAHILIIRDDKVSEAWLYKFSVFFNLLLPASYAALEGVIYFNEWMLIKKYCGAAGISLKEAEKLLPADLEKLTFEECHTKQAQVLHLISGVMLLDNRNWNLLLEDKDNYHLIV